MNLSFLISVQSLMLQALSFFAVYESGEIFSSVSVVSVFLFVIGSAVSMGGTEKKKIFLLGRNYFWFQFVLYLSAVLLAGVAAFALSLPFLVTVANSYLVFLGLFQFTPASSRSNGVRLILAFVGIVIASALTSEALLGLILCVFMFFSFLQTAFLYLASQEKGTQRKLEGSFLVHYLSISMIGFFASLLIFFILPRPSFRTDQWFDLSLKSRLGYTEEVDLNHHIRFSSDENSPVAIRFFFKTSPSPKELLEIFPKHLLRSKVLERYKEGRWLSVSSAKFERNKLLVPTGNELKAETRTEEWPNDWIEVLREPYATSFLALPYTATQLASFHREDDSRFFQTKSQESVLTQSERERVKFRMRVASRKLGSSTEHSEAMPTAAYLFETPKNYDFRLKELAGQIFKGAITAKEKFTRLSDFFRAKQFQASLGGKTDAKSTYVKDSGRSSVEQFLFLTRSGHCELFATASALLLREAGVPTRLVAGFRISRQPFADVLIVKEKDAHAWVEAFDERLKEWVPLDYTPSLSQPAGIFDFLTNSQELFSSLWFRYVIREDRETIFKKEEVVAWMTKIVSNESLSHTAILLFLCAVAFLGFIFILFRFANREKIDSTRLRAIRLWRKEQKKVKRAKALQKVYADFYEHFRFGAKDQIDFWLKHFIQWKKENLK